MYLRNTNRSLSIFQALNLHFLKQFFFLCWIEKKIFMMIMMLFLPMAFKAQLNDISLVAKALK